MLRTCYVATFCFCGGKKIQVRYVCSSRQMIKTFSLRQRLHLLLELMSGWNDTPWNRVVNVAVFNFNNDNITSDVNWPVIPKNVIYLASYTKCHLQYVGSTHIEFKIRYPAVTNLPAKSQFILINKSLHNLDDFCFPMYWPSGGFRWLSWSEFRQFLNHQRGILDCTIVHPTTIWLEQKARIPL